MIALLPQRFGEEEVAVIGLAGFLLALVLVRHCFAWLTRHRPYELPPDDLPPSLRLPETTNIQADQTGLKQL
jgi:hypothetical protein